MALSEFAVRGAKGRDRPYKLVDERGLYLLITPKAQRYWRFNYRFEGKQKTLAFGVYPDIGLAYARERRDAARRLVAKGYDPALEEQRLKAERLAACNNSFHNVATEWLAKLEKEGRAKKTMSKTRWLLDHVFPFIGERPIDEIKATDVLAALRAMEAHGKYESARRLRSDCSRVFRYGIATGRCERDVAAGLLGALITPRVKHMAAVTTADKFSQLLRAIDGYEGHPISALALKILPHVFVRPGELRHAEWREVDVDKQVWTIPEHKMKMRLPHTVPLSRQVLTLLQQLKQITGQSALLFPSIRTPTRPMSENTINGTLRRLGYGQNEMTGHGFRTTASTLLNEMGTWHPDAIERQLAHADTNSVRRIYARGEYWKERVAMMQTWSDYIDELRGGAGG
jgi:integrase